MFARIPSCLHPQHFLIPCRLPLTAVAPVLVPFLPQMHRMFILRLVWGRSLSIDLLTTSLMGLVRLWVLILILVWNLLEDRPSFPVFLPRLVGCVGPVLLYWRMCSLKGSPPVTICHLLSPMFSR
ncbi:hypothetical protein C8R42DRAFT_463649 [Lentinula raphanica]|nr:hypothetical protein C8R42DRAFT_463649 [Lentinula raphanica]